MNKLTSVVSWYQQKIGAYDKQLWEKSVEQRVLKSIAQVPKKSARVKPELIDVDLVRGSTFSKAKPQHGVLSVSRRGVLRVLFFPLYLRWWSSQTSRWLVVLLAVLYVLQVASSAMFIIDSQDVNSYTQDLSVVHIITPWVMMLVLGVLHAQIVSTRPSHKIPPRNKPKRKAKARRRKSRAKYKRSSEHDSASQETSVDTNVEDIAEGSSAGQKRLCKCMHYSHAAPCDNPQMDPITSQVKSHSIPHIIATDADKIVTSTPKHPKRDFPNNVQCSGQVITDWHTGSSPGMINSNLSTEEDPGHHFEPMSDRLGLHNQHFDNFNLVYKTHDSEEEVTCNTQEDPSLWVAPITDVTGQLLHPQNGEIKLSEGVVEKVAEKVVEDVPSSCTLVKNRMDTGFSSDSPPDGEAHQKESQLTNGTPEEETVAGTPEEESRWCRTCHGFLGAPPDVASKQCPRSSPQHSPRATSQKAARKGNIQHLRIVTNSRKESTGNSTCESEVDSPPNTPFLNKMGGVPPSQSSRRWSSASSKASPSNLRVRELSSSAMGAVGSNIRNTSPQPSLPLTTLSPSSQAEGGTSEMDWEDTMNSDVTSSDTTGCTSSSDSDDSKSNGKSSDCPFSWPQHVQHSSSVMNNLASSSDKVSCMIFEEEEVKKVDLTVLDIGFTIIQKVDSGSENSDYIVVGMVFSVAMALLPLLFRLYRIKDDLDIHEIDPSNIIFSSSFIICKHWRPVFIIGSGMLQRFCLSLIFFFLLSVAERTFKQRLLYAKNFCYLTSSRRAKKYELPHFRLNKVRNIKTWLSLRSYLKKRGPQRSVDTIVSSAFLLAIMLVSLMSFELLNDSQGFLEQMGHWELIVCCMGLAVYLLRFMTLGTKINKKYRNFSVLITEQINLYLHMEQKPHKKEELMLANSVLKLAEDLLKELESPFKISGMSANPFLYNITKVVILSAFSAVLTELLGFKLKLYKIKIRA